MGTVIVSAFLAVIIAAIIYGQIKARRAGKASCGSNCAHCAMSGKCHTKKGEGLPPGAHDVTHTPPSAVSNADRNAGFMITLKIDGMSCSMCESHINDTIRNTFKVKSVKSNHKTGVCIIISEEKIDETKLIESVEKTGYKIEQVSYS